MSDQDRKDEKDENDDAEGDDESSAEEESPAKNAEKDGAEGDDQEEEDEAEEKPAPKAAAKPAAKPAPKPAAKGSAGKAPLAKRAAGARGKPLTPQARKSGGSLGKSMILFVLIVGGLAAAFALLGREDNAGPAAPKWTAGQTPELELTLVASDKKDLGCALGDEPSGKHCAFEGENKPWSKGDVTDDKKLLKPYTTTDHVQILAAGLWSDPAMAGTLPAARFSVKCKFKVDGKASKASVRWASDGPWYPVNDIYTGAISDCKLVP